MIEIDRNLHLYGEKAWRFAVWLAKQLPAGMSVTTVDDFTYDSLLNDPDIVHLVCTSRTRGNPEKAERTLAILHHTGPSSTMLLHDAIHQPNFVYTVQEGDDIDVMEGIESVDTDCVLMQDLHFFGTGFTEFFNTTAEWFKFGKSVQAYNVDNEEQYKTAHAKKGISWTYSETPPNYSTDVPVIRLYEGKLRKLPES